MVDDSIHHLMVGEERDDLHGAAAVRPQHRVNLIDLTDHLSPALGGDMGDDPGNELQVVQPVHPFGFFPIPVEDRALRMTGAINPCHTRKNIQETGQKGAPAHFPLETAVGRLTHHSKIVNRS